MGTRSAIAATCQMSGELRTTKPPDTMLNKFLVDSENTVREMVELAAMNWLGTRFLDHNDHYRRELAILAEQFLEKAKGMEECWRAASKCAALA